MKNGKASVTEHNTQKQGRTNSEITKVQINPHARAKRNPGMAPVNSKRK